MDPFRDELAAANARIAELEATLKRMRPSAKPSIARCTRLAVTLLLLVVGFLTSPVQRVVASTPSNQSRTWECRFPHEADPLPGPSIFEAAEAQPQLLEPQFRRRNFTSQRRSE